MGGQSSKSEQQFETDITSEAFNECKGANVSNSIIINQVQHRPEYNPACTADSTFRVEQGANVESKCLISHLQQITADSIANLDAEAQAGLGFAFSENKNEILTQLNTKVENECTGLSLENKAEISDTVITACNFMVIQDATVKDSCVINSLQNTANRATVESRSTASGASIWGILFGEGTSWLLLIVAIIVVIFVLYMFSSGSAPTGYPSSNGAPSSGYPSGPTSYAAESSGYPSSYSNFAASSPAAAPMGSQYPVAQPVSNPYGSTPSEPTNPFSSNYAPAMAQPSAPSFPPTNPFSSQFVPSGSAPAAPITNPFQTGYVPPQFGGADFLKTLTGGAICSMGPVWGLGVLLVIGLVIYLTRPDRSQEGFDEVESSPANPSHFTDNQQIDRSQMMQNPSMQGYFFPDNVNQPNYSEIYKESHNTFNTRPDWARKYISVDNGIISVYRIDGTLLAQAPRRYHYEQNGIYFNLLADGSEVVADNYGILGVIPSKMIWDDWNNPLMTNENE